MYRCTIKVGNNDHAYNEFTADLRTKIEDPVMLFVTEFYYILFLMNLKTNVSINFCSGVVKKYVFLYTVNFHFCFFSK